MEDADTRHKSVTKTLYDYVQWIKKQETSYYEGYLTKVHRMMTVQFALFAGMAFAVNKAEWVSGIYSVILVMIGLLAGSFLYLAFRYCIKCLWIGEVSVPGIKVLEEIVKEDKTVSLVESSVNNQLSEKLLMEIREDRVRADIRKDYGPKINKNMSRGAFFVALLIGYATIGNVFGSQRQFGDMNMTEDNKATSTDTSNNQSDANEPTPQASSSLVEPTATAQRGSTDKPLVEPTQALTLSQEKKKQ